MDIYKRTEGRLRVAKDKRIVFDDSILSTGRLHRTRSEIRIDLKQVRLLYVENDDEIMTRSFELVFTSTLVVDTRFIGRTLGVTSTANVAHQPVANFAAPAVVVFATKRFTYGDRRVTLFVPVAVGVGRAHGLTRIVFARVPCRTFSTFVARFSWRSDTRYFGRGIRDESHSTRTHGSLVRHCAYSVRSARYCQTRVGAHIVSTRFDRSAVLV